MSLSKIISDREQKILKEYSPINHQKETIIKMKKLEDMVNSNDPLTSVVILSYNRTNDIRKNINSLYERTDLPFEVIIFDNNSQPDTIKYLNSIDGMQKEDGNGQVKVVYSDTNLGCSGGRREAVKLARGDYIYTIDNDMTYDEGWLEALIDRIESEDKIGAVSSKIVFPDNTVQLNGSRLNLEEGYFGDFEEVDQGKNYLSDNLTGEIECDWLCGGATLFKREVVEQVEHALEYLNGYEDYDYSFQIQDLGYKLLNCPDSTVFHHHIGFDKVKQKKETEYLKDRWSSERTWKSMVYFLERTGINMVKTGGFYDWIERDGSKPFLKWGQIGEIKFEYNDFFPGKAFSELSNAEIREQFDDIVTTNKKVRQYQVFRNGTSKDILDEFSDEMEKVFCDYNANNLARHLDGVIARDYSEMGFLSKEEGKYIVDEIRANTSINDVERANELYQKMEERFAKIYMTY